MVHSSPPWSEFIFTESCYIQLSLPQQGAAGLDHETLSEKLLGGWAVPCCVCFLVEDQSHVLFIYVSGIEQKIIDYFCWKGLQESSGSTA